MTEAAANARSIRSNFRIEEVGTGDAKKKILRCNLCDKTFNFDRNGRNSSHNYHLQAYHRDVYDEILGSKNEDDDESGEETEAGATQAASASSASTKRSPSAVAPPKTKKKETSEGCLQKLLNMLAEARLPFTLVDRESFKSLMISIRELSGLGWHG